jgi:acyl carrier protein phosphodiesterase
MNFLGHAYLSFGDPEILVGNMISDFVKGKARLGFNGKIGKGIVLHRLIDEYTDSHPATKKAREIFRPQYRLYCGAVMDVLYDHYLANDPRIFTEASLKSFTETTYNQLEKHTFDLPLNFLTVFTYMRKDNWLYHYRTREGMRKSLAGLVRRAAYLSDSGPAFELFNIHYDFLGTCYQEFIADVKTFTKAKYDALI